jgi:Ca2+-binding EF-hand superfamily protein
MIQMSIVSSIQPERATILPELPYKIKTNTAKVKALLMTILETDNSESEKLEEILDAFKTLDKNLIFLVEKSMKS